MSSAGDGVEVYLERFREMVSRSQGASSPAWHTELRRSALRTFEAEGFPDPRREEWRYTNVRPLVRQPFRSPSEALCAVSSRDLESVLFPELTSEVWLFVNGQPRLDLLGARSVDASQGDGAVALLGHTLRHRPDALRDLLGSIVSYRDNSFSALNTAFMEDGAYIELPSDARLPKPIHLIFLATAEQDPIVCHPRVVVRTGHGSELVLIEHHVGLPGSRNFSNAVTEILAEEGSHIEHYRIQQESAQGYHVGSAHVHLRRDSRYVSHNVNLGGRLVRNDINVKLAEPGAEVQLNGLFMVDGRQHVDNHTRVHHAAPHTRSDESYRGVAAGHGRGVFKGRVLVERGAQKIEAHQASGNLLLADTAEIDTKPELEIYADDVVCSHGATVGQLDEASIFYLRTRAIDEATARALLTFAFADEVIARMSLQAIRTELERIIVGRLPESQKLKEFV